MTVWVETRMRRDRIWINVSPTPGQGRATTLALLSEVAAQNAIECQVIEISIQWGV